MPPQLQINEIIAERLEEIEVTENVGVPGRLPAAERVVSVNARVEITDVTVSRGVVIIEGIIRATIFYASEEDPSNIISFRRTIEFTERISVGDALPNYTAIVEASIADIDFFLVNDRLIGLEFTIAVDIEVTARQPVDIIEERPEFDFRRRRITVRRQIRERNFSRQITAVEPLPEEAEDIRRIISVESNIRIIDIYTDDNKVIVRGVILNNIVYSNQQGEVEFVSISFPFTESFTISGVTAEMTPFVEATVTEEDADLIDNDRLRFTIGVNFNILVVTEETVEIPTEVVAPDDLFPVRRTILIERIVAQERTRILESGRITVPEGNPDVARVIRANGRIQGGTLTVEAEEGGVVIDGEVAVDVIYVADLPEQPVYFVSDIIPVSAFINIPGVNPGMEVYADVTVDRVTATRISAREINARIVLEVNLIVTERVRVPVITDVTREPVREPVEDRFVTYIVRPGDTLYLIGQRYGVTVQRLIEINNIVNPNQLRVGQRLLIPR